MKNASSKIPIASAVMCGISTILGIIIFCCVTLPLWASIVLLIMLGCNCVCVAACVVSHSIIKELKRDIERDIEIGQYLIWYE